jgi:mono/diheme cytochrome c family protein
MKPLGSCVLLLLALVAVISAQSQGRLTADSSASVSAAIAPSGATSVAASAAPATSAAAHQTFTKYCVECHGLNRPKGGVSIERLIGQMSSNAVGEQADAWEDVAEMLETRQMPPPDDAELFPSDAERASAAEWIRASLRDYEAAHAGEPGRVTVRRLTSAEFAYAIRDLTGVDIKTGVDASSDAVGGEGFANFGDVQFVQDASVERYLEASKQIAEHAVIGSGPLAFYTDSGETGLELSALNRIEQLYASRGFRVVSGEGGRPFGFDRYAKAFYVAWHYRHRAAMGEPTVTLRDLAAREGITGRFAEHIWETVNRPVYGYPSKLWIERWRKLPAPAQAASNVRTECEALVKDLVAWPSWLFARGDLAAGGAGDESPLVFDDTTLMAAPSHTYNFGLNRRFSQNGPYLVPGPWTVHLAVDALHRTPASAGTPAVIWRNARVVLRTPPPPPDPKENAAVARRRPPGPIVSTFPLRSVLPADAVARLAFGTSPDGAPVGPDDFATTQTTSLTIELPDLSKLADLPASAGDPKKLVAELHVDIELGRDRQAVMRVMIADRPNGPARIPGQRVLLGDPAGDGYRTFRAGITEYLALMPPNSHGEANPADKDPVPAPFDNTYNSPEHDAFVINVKYQRTDPFFTSNIVDGEDRARLEHAWTDLFGSWPYHDAYLGMLVDHYKLANTSRKIDEMTPAAIAALPAEVRPHVRKLRAHYDAIRLAMKRAEPGHVTDAIAFAGRAWRRPLTPVERTNLRAFYTSARTTLKLDHGAAVRALIARILMSPAFLYRLESAPRETETTLNDWELASRLSFFLWSSIPDDELRRAAAAGELRDPERLSRQVKRMTADPKARRIATEFFGQWLGFYHFDEYRGVDTGRFPEFTDEVRASMYDEAVSTFEYLVREERPVKEILHADYAFLNKTLAKFYGIDAAASPAVAAAPAGKVQRIEGARAFDRGGALRLGSVLTTTSAPLRTSPVKRGDWILRRILSTPTPPPPADAGTLPADDKTFNGLTLRERLTQHKRNAQCASCHLKIDPLGFPLEAFDAVGRTRQTYSDGKPVDVTGEFRDKTTIVGADGLLTYLNKQDQQVRKTLSRKMIGYALGRNPHASDRRLILDMVSAGGDVTFSDLAIRIVTSRQFRNRAGRAGAAPAPATAGHSSTAGQPSKADQP